jgi:hypothetical protein
MTLYQVLPLANMKDWLERLEDLYTEKMMKNLLKMKLIIKVIIFA